MQFQPRLFSELGYVRYINGMERSGRKWARIYMVVSSDYLGNQNELHNGDRLVTGSLSGGILSLRMAGGLGIW